MKKLFTSIVFGLTLLMASGAQAVQVTNTMTAFYETFNGAGIGIDLTGVFSGIGTIARTYSAPGSYEVKVLIENDLGVFPDGTGTGFFPEIGAVVGTPAFNYELWSMTDLNDLAVWMGWEFTLLTGQAATVAFSVSETAPLEGGYLTHTDAVYLEPDFVEYQLLEDTIYYTSSLRIDTSGTNAVPEPSTFVLFGSGIAAAAFYARRRRSS